MKISDLVKHLNAEMSEHGDLTVCTYDGEIVKVDSTPCRDGVMWEKGGPVAKPNELVIEFGTSAREFRDMEG